MTSYPICLNPNKGTRMVAYDTFTTITKIIWWTLKMCQAMILSALYLLTFFTLTL